MIDNTELMTAYNKLNIDEKKVELINLITKTEKLIEVALHLEGYDNKVDIKRGDNMESQESENLSLLYENLWNIKNQLLLLYNVSINNKNSN